MKRIELLYGAGGTGKSTQAAILAEWVHKNWGLKTRVVNADGGGTASAFAHLIELGIAELWDIDLWTDTSIFALLDFATKGYWPEDVSVPNSRLLPAVETLRVCPNPKCGHAQPGPIIKCVKCSQAPPQGVLCPVKVNRLNGSDTVGLECFEGLTAFSDNLMRRLRTIDPGGGNTIKDQNFSISSPGQHHYLAAQSYIAQFVSNTRQLPYPLVLWTALELRADDDGKPVYGPQGPGKKTTSTCIPWFTDVLHLDSIAKTTSQGIVEKDKDGLEILDRKIYLQPHFPPDNKAFKFVAKTSRTYAGPGTPAAPGVIEADMGKVMEMFIAHEQAAKARAGR